MEMQKVIVTLPQAKLWWPTWLPHCPQQWLLLCNSSPRTLSQFLHYGRLHLPVFLCVFFFKNTFFLSHFHTCTRNLLDTEKSYWPSRHGTFPTGPSDTAWEFHRSQSQQLMQRCQTACDHCFEYSATNTLQKIIFWQVIHDSVLKMKRLANMVHYTNAENTLAHWKE